jgi:hypothetical protein
MTVVNKDKSIINEAVITCVKENQVYAPRSWDSSFMELTQVYWWGRTTGQSLFEI